MCIYLDKKNCLQTRAHGAHARARHEAATARHARVTGRRAAAHWRTPTEAVGVMSVSAVKVEATTERSVWRFKESSPHFWTPSPRRQPRWSTNLGTDVDQNFPLPSAVYKIEQERLSASLATCWK